MADDPVDELERIPIDYMSKPVESCKLNLISKIPRAEKLLVMYQMKKRAFEKKLIATFQAQKSAWISPQIELTNQYIEQTQKMIAHFDDPSFNSSHLLDYLENLYAFREKQKWINEIDVGTNELGPMTIIQIESIHLITKLLRESNIIDLPNDEELPKDIDTNPPSHIV